MSVSASRVWITTGRPDDAAISSWRSKTRALHLAGREIVVVVEPCLTDGDRIRVREQLDQLVDAAGVRACRLVRVDPERGEHTLLGTRRSQAPPGTTAIPVPIVTIRETPTARARSTRNAAGSSHPSRWACVSITRGDRGRRSRRGSIEPGEERRGRLDPSVSPVTP